MLEFPGGRGNGEIGAWKRMLERYVGNVDGVWENLGETVMSANIFGKRMII